MVHVGIAVSMYVMEQQNSISFRYKGLEFVGSPGRQQIFLAPDEVRQWEVLAIDLLNPDWNKLTPEQKINEAKHVYGRDGMMRAPIRLVGAFATLVGIEIAPQSHPIAVIANRELNRRVRGVVDLAYADLRHDDEIFSPQTLIRRAFNRPVSYGSFGKISWDEDVMYAVVLTAAAERGVVEGVTEHSNMHDPRIYWPGFVMQGLLINELAKNEENQQIRAGMLRFIGRVLSHAGFAVDDHAFMESINSRIVA
jgi:hypothetical protein